MSSYIGKYAEYYDTIYAQKDYAGEAAFLAECLGRFGVSAPADLLEIACGTGSHALALERLAYRLKATDHSQDLLAVAHKKGEQAGAKVEFTWADMRELALEKRDFDAAICLFDSIGYVQTDAAIKSVFAGVRKHLKPGGLFLFEFWHAPPMRANFDPLRIGRWDLDNGVLVRIAQTQVDEAQDLASVSYELIELGHDGRYTRTTETQVNRFFSVDKMKSLIEAAGFEPLNWLNGYSWDEAIDENCWHVFCVAQAARD